MNRRDLLAGTCARLGIAAAWNERSAFAQVPPAPPVIPVPTWKTDLRKLAPNVYGYVQAGGPGIPSLSVANAGVVAGDEHVLVIDALGAPLHAKNFMAAVAAAVPNKPMGRIVITHHHPDHIVGLPLFPKMEVIAHEYCRQAMSEMNFPPLWEKRDGWADGGESRRVVLPTTTIREKTTLYYGDTEVQIIPLIPAHTWGDVIVYLPKSKILFAGDIGFFWVAPFLNNGHATKWIEACDRILDMEVDVIVPGHGPIGGKKELADMRGYLQSFKQEARLRFNGGMSAGKACADMKLGKYEAWIGASDRLPLNVVRCYAEFAGTLTPETDSDGVRRATEEFKAIRGN